MKMAIHVGAITLLCALAGCGGGNSVIGRWGDLVGAQYCTGADVTEFTSDGRVTRGEQVATWRADGDRVTIVARGREISATLSGDTLTIEGERTAQGEATMGETLHRCPG